MPRRYDPDRRRRIVDAAVTVVAERGIAGLSHRAVAAAADVPLGSTTYHFADRDELLTAALERINDAWLTRFAALLDAVDPARPPTEALAGALADHLGDCLGPHRADTELAYELYFAGLRRPALRPLAADCVDRMTGLLPRRAVPDGATARALIAAADGMLIHFLLTERPYDPGEARATFARLLTGGGLSGIGTGSHGGAPTR
ncbi:TetR/AcrR family transcriptional regulator [Streptomyces sp. NBC_01803]|uniref:TetR/AcrR family transcriptional regulator n=1 Tax=Streptomyces sp. NBC_01803 TaxID=2975946 RepID=UPI002DDAC206|nr:TetR family transcriptional regulator [Streptomyces sp. NBC_01803]WSA46785.1 TetR family transcriptional regulator [Streptomyces sp. NBC_01803]